jgi:serine/threonine protein kinase
VSSKKGYSKAVDMWSIGAIATALLTGDVIFTDRLNPTMRENPAKVILELSSKCDLSILDNTSSAWCDVGRRPKDFVRSLLVVDESKRFNVKQALAHEWFTNKYYDEEFKAVYKKATKDWQPRRKSFRVVEALDLNRLNTLPAQKDVDDQTRSRFFRRLSVPFPQGDLYPIDIPPPDKVLYRVLPTIGEEATPEPETPKHSKTDAPMVPKAKKPDLSATPLDVQYSLSKLDLDADVPPSEATTDIAMTDQEQLDDPDSFDLDAPFPANRQLAPNPLQSHSQDLYRAEVVQETPPMDRKRSREPGMDKWDSSLEVTEECSVREDPANMSKKMRMY